MIDIRQGDCLDLLRQMPDESVHCCVTSPPYWGGVRDYGHASQMGIEREPSAYVGRLVDVFAEVRRVLVLSGSLWLNVGDVFAASGKGGGGKCGTRACWETVKDRKGFRMPPEGFKRKDLTLVSFALADALRRDGWYLRQTVIWKKPSAVEPNRLDRPSTSHEYVFLLAKSETYSVRNPGEPWWSHSVWEIANRDTSGHPAEMPLELARRCILAGSEEGGTVLDPFSGHGTTLVAANRLKRKAIGLELNSDYIQATNSRLVSCDSFPLMDGQVGLFDLAEPTP